MSVELPKDFERLVQPPDVEFHTVDGVFIKQMRVMQRDAFIPQHAHVYEHASLYLIGSVRVFKDGVHDGDFHAPHCFSIPAGVKHTFQSLTDTMEIWCIHNLHRKEIVEILEEHHLVD